MTKLNDLFEHGGQSPWLDNIRRSWIQDGTLSELVNKGIRGLTSNPTIFTKAIEGSADYDEQFYGLIKDGLTVEAAYWELVKTDINGALDILSKTYDNSNGRDGFVSIEVSPLLARDTENTLKMAVELNKVINKPNLLVKIPATKEGLPAITEMIAEGRSVNITLIFSLERYGEVIDAYMSGLEKSIESGETDLSKTASVASFFVSRVDTEVDKRLLAVGGDKAQSLMGKAAVAQAKLAYELFQERFSSSRWLEIEKYGAQVQRPLWASTSTKNPSYPDLLYVDNLIGPSTVNTMPDNTVEAFLDHGKVKTTVNSGIDEVKSELAEIESLGISMAEVTDLLEQEGIDSFRNSFVELLDTLGKKAANK